MMYVSRILVGIVGTCVTRQDTGDCGDASMYIVLMYWANYLDLDMVDGCALMYTQTYDMGSLRAGHGPLHRFQWFQKLFALI